MDAANNGEIDVLTCIVNTSQQRQYVRLTDEDLIFRWSSLRVTVPHLARWSVGHPATINHQIVAGDVGCIVARQE